MALLRIEKPQWVGLSLAFAQKVGNGHAARSEICNLQSSGTQQRCAISSAIALADCTWLLDIGDRRMRIGDVRKPASDFLCKTTSDRDLARFGSLNTAILRDRILDKPEKPA